MIWVGVVEDTPVSSVYGTTAYPLRCAHTDTVASATGGTGDGARSHHHETAQRHQQDYGWARLA